MILWVVRLLIYMGFSKNFRNIKKPLKMMKNTLFTSI